MGISLRDYAAQSINPQGYVLGLRSLPLISSKGRPKHITGGLNNKAGPTLSRQVSLSTVEGALGPGTSFSEGRAGSRRDDLGCVEYEQQRPRGPRMVQAERYKTVLARPKPCKIRPLSRLILPKRDYRAASGYHLMTSTSHPTRRVQVPTFFLRFNLHLLRVCAPLGKNLLLEGPWVRITSALEPDGIPGAEGLWEFRGQIQGVEFVGAFRDELKFGSSKTSRERGAE